MNGARAAASAEPAAPPPAAAEVSTASRRPPPARTYAAAPNTPWYSPLSLSLGVAAQVEIESNVRKQLITF